jgi:hypothetical protein
MASPLSAFLAIYKKQYQDLMGQIDPAVPSNPSTSRIGIGIRQGAMSGSIPAAKVTNRSRTRLSNPIKIGVRGTNGY